jgi:hypothetical protein
MTSALPLLAVAVAFAMATTTAAQTVPTAPDSKAVATDPTPIEPSVRELDPAVGLPAPGAGGEAAPIADTAPAPSDTAAPPARPILPPPPVMKPGTKLRYRIVSTAETRRSAETKAGRNEQTIELEAIEAPGKTPVLRYVIVDGEVKDDPLAGAMLAASRGVATDLEADATGRPLKLTAWDKVRATILERLLLDPTAPLDGAKRARSMLTSMDGVSAIPFAVPEVLMMADMQGWKDVPPGRTDDPVKTSGVGDTQGRFTGYREVAPEAEGACVIALKRVTELDPASPLARNRAASERLETTAEVSTIDGWVVSLKQERSRLVGSTRDARSWTITRADPPACPPPA